MIYEVIEQWEYDSYTLGYFDDRKKAERYTLKTNHLRGMMVAAR